MEEQGELIRADYLSRLDAIGAERLESASDGLDLAVLLSGYVSPSATFLLPARDHPSALGLALRAERHISAKYETKIKVTDSSSASRSNGTRSTVTWTTGCRCGEPHTCCGRRARGWRAVFLCGRGGRRVIVGACGSLTRTGDAAQLNLVISTFSAT